MPLTPPQCGVLPCSEWRDYRRLHSATLSIPQAYPGTPSFQSLIIPLNLRLNYTPVALALPTTIPQIQDAVKCASKFGVRVNPRSGGHSYASHSLGGEDGHLVVDLRYFRDVVVDRKTNVATIGPGARLGNVALALFEQGERALPHGVCPGVGIGGHVLHGGQGYSTHTHGLLLDHLISATVILPNSTLVTVSRTHHSSLFWALRGAGMSFGIVTSLQFLTLPAPPQNILFYYPYLWTEPQARLGWDAWQSYCGGLIMPREMNIRWVVANYGGGFAVFLLEGHYHGSQADFDLSIAPLLSALGKIGGLQEGIRGVGAHALGWIDALLYANNNGLFNDLGSGEPLETPLNYSVHSTFFTKSLMTSNLSPPSIDVFLNRLYNTSPISPVTSYLIIFAQGGPTSAVPLPLNPQTSTSYAHRTSLYEWQFIASLPSPPFPAAGIDWLNAFVGDIERAEVDAQRVAAGGAGNEGKGGNGGGGVLGAYYNYADPSLGRGEDSGGRYWLTNYPILKALKRRYDPDFVFMNPQTVGT
ncbi:hypothetical protein IFR05_002780 [Cadophora sp. M221]|nr:hypothetical protein IFR05_002780 [Cadophora sp. M221]